MTALDHDTLHAILAFAAHVGRSWHTDPMTVARRRNWIDEDQRPTDEGRALVTALADQSATRTVFRGNF
jgi:hypothetical protein